MMERDELTNQEMIQSMYLVYDTLGRVVEMYNGKWTEEEMIYIESALQAMYSSYATTALYSIKNNA